MARRPGAQKPTARPKAAAAAALLAGTLVWAAPSNASGADVAEVRGGAYGQHVTVAGPGAPTAPAGPAPAVTTAPGGGTTTEAAPSTTVEGDPAGAFGGAYLRTGPLTAASSGATGAAGSVTTAATAGSVDALGGVLTAEKVAATCAADEAGSTGSVSVAGGRVALSGTETVDLPSEPVPGTTLTATTGEGERVTVVLNEQQVVDGTLVVNAVRVTLDGPTVTGSIVVAAASCGVTTAPAADPTTATTTTASAGSPGTRVPTTAAPAVHAPTVPAPTEDGTALAPTDGDTVAGTAEPSTSGSAETAAASAPAAPVDTSIGVRAAAGALQSVTVSAVSGSAFGYHVRIRIFNSPVQERGPAPTATLPASGSASPVTGTVPSAVATVGPAVLFMSGEITVRAQGTTGLNGSATSSTSIARSTDQEPPGPFLFDRVASSCTATAAGVSGTTTITGGKLETKYDATSQEPTVVEDIPVNPAPNTTRTGTLDHIKDSYRAVFNEQVQNGDGSLTVNAVHLYLLGPTGVGDVVIGQSRCGVTKAAVETSTTTTGATSGAAAAGETAGGTAVAGSSTAASSGTAATGSAATGSAAGSAADSASPSSGGTAVAGTSQSRRPGTGNTLAVTGGSLPRLLPLGLFAAALAAARLRRSQDEGPTTGP